jgi:phytoene dehydrogenase-like protein
MEKRDYDAIVVGAGPNGLAAAITLQNAGLEVLLIEGKETTGGGLRCGGLTLPGFVHDICSAVHPLAVESAFFKKFPLAEHGVEFIQPPIAAAHPLDDGRAAVLDTSVERTALSLGADGETYLQLMRSLLKIWPGIATDLLGPLRIPGHPVDMMRFGILGIPSVKKLISRFHTPEARGLMAGMGAHAMQPLSNLTTSAFALILSVLGHKNGWPFPKGGSGQIARAMSSRFISMGGKVETGLFVHSLKQLPSSRALLLDVTPRQLLKIAGYRPSEIYRWQLRRYRYGMGVFKVDWALDEAVPFTAAACRQAGTVHLGNTFEEIENSERMTWQGKIPSHPCVLLAQPSLFDDSRAPAGKHTAWAYCHTPPGSSPNMTELIEKQVERFAPGFRDRILARHSISPLELEAYNPNDVGGDINGGVQDIRQLFTRPALRFSPYRTSQKGIYLCSASTPPGGGVHGLCGYYAAQRALRDIFNRETG